MLTPDGFVATFVASPRSRAPLRSPLVGLLWRRLLLPGQLEKSGISYSDGGSKKAFEDILADHGPTLHGSESGLVKAILSTV